MHLILRWIEFGLPESCSSVVPFQCAQEHVNPLRDIDVRAAEIICQWWMGSRYFSIYIECTQVNQFPVLFFLEESPLENQWKIFFLKFRKDRFSAIWSKECSICNQNVIRHSPSDNQFADCAVQLPVLEVDGVIFPQSLAICRYIGKISGSIPEDPLQASSHKLTCLQISTPELHLLDVMVHDTHKSTKKLYTPVARERTPVPTNIRLGEVGTGLLHGASSDRGLYNDSNCLKKAFQNFVNPCPAFRACLCSHAVLMAIFAQNLIVEPWIIFLGVTGLCRWFMLRLAASGSCLVSLQPQARFLQILFESCVTMGVLRRPISSRHHEFIVPRYWDVHVQVQAPSYVMDCRYFHMFRIPFSRSFLAGMSVTPKSFIFIIYKNLFLINLSKKYLISFRKQKHWFSWLLREACIDELRMKAIQVEREITKQTRPSKSVDVTLCPVKPTTVRPLIIELLLTAK